MTSPVLLPRGRQGARVPDHVLSARPPRAAALYRAFDQDALDNRELLARKLRMPVLAVGGAQSTSGRYIPEMMREVAEDVTGLIVPESAHWVPEEKPELLIPHLVDFPRGAPRQATRT